MEFDKSRVYTALNADELEVGSMVIVADSLQGLKDRLNKSASDEDYISRIGSILPETAIHRFKTLWGGEYPLAYLISPPKKPEYKPFSDTETAFKIITAHGVWIKYKNTYFSIHGISIGREDFKEILVGRVWHSARFVCENCTFADDGTPVGEKVEDSDTEEDCAT